MTSFRIPFRIGLLATLVFGAALGHSLLFRAQLTTSGPVCFTLGFSNTLRVSTNNLALPVGVKVMAGTTQVYSQTVTSDSTGKVTATLPASASTSHTVTLTPVGHMPVVFRIDGDLSGTCITVPAPARAGDVNSDGTVTTADLIGLIQAMRGIPSTTVSQMYGVPTIRLTQVVEAIRHMRTAQPGNLVVTRNGAGGGGNGGGNTAGSSSSSQATVAHRSLPTYGGHPSIPNITAISPKIVVSRTSGMTPFALQVHAGETTATFSDGGAAFQAATGRAFDPYLDLEYRWNFGHASGTETFTHPVTGEIVNANDDQAGPEATYLYRSAGNYTVTLTARAWNGTSYVTASTTTVNVPEIQQISIAGSPTGGTFTLSLAGQTTAALAHNATAIEVEDALEGLPTIGTSNVQETKNGHYYMFRSSKLGTDMAQMTATSTLSGGTSPSVKTRTVQEGTSASSITVTAWSGTDQYFDSEYDGSNGVSNGTIERPYTTVANIHTWLTGGTYRRALLKRGSNFDDAQLLVTNPSVSFRNIRVEPYGTGEDPILRHFYSYTRKRDDHYTDVVFSDIHFFTNISSNPGEWPISIVRSNNGGGDWHNIMRDWSFIDCTFGGPVTIQHAEQTTTPETRETGMYFTFWQPSFYRNSNTLMNGQAILMGLARGFAMVGGSFIGGSGDPVRDHYIYPQIHHHSLYRWNEFLANDNLNFCINTNARKDGQLTMHVLMDGNDFTNTTNGIDASNGEPGNDPALGQFDKFIIQQNAFHDLSEPGQTGGVGWFSANLIDAVSRDNYFWNNNQADYAMNAASTRLFAYRNKHWATKVIIYSDGVGGYVADNVFMTLAATYINPIIYFKQATMASWFFTGNQYYSPNMVVSGANKPFTAEYDTFWTFPQWQALGFDTNGSYADPGWTDPASGDFR